jgi:hypothetical protein
MHYFGFTKVVKQPFYSIGPKMISGWVSEDFANLRQVKRCKTSVWAWMHYFGVPKFWSIHSTPLDPKWCLRVFRNILLTFSTLKDEKLVFQAWMHYFEVPKLWSVHSIPLDSKWCLGVFWSILIVAKLVFVPECTTSWYQSCERTILVHWTQNDFWESFRAFH